ncbi:S41 family peptidase [bacterium]|nr:S41 family peptidase [bacterium]
MKKYKVFLFFIVVLFGIASFGSGFLLGKSSVHCKVCPPEDVDFSLFWEAWREVHKKFVDPQKLDTKKMIYGAISGMLESLEDPYTVFLEPRESKVFSEDISGKFEGVGMEIGIVKGELQVITPLEGTPAQKAGLRPGDKIVKIDGKPSLHISLDEAVKLIRGPRGTEVTLTILREGWEEPRDFKIKRDIVEIPSLKWEIKEGDIAYIKLYHFTQLASYDFNKASKEILKSPAKRIILDLRNNPGGYLEVARIIAGWFLEKGELVAIEDFGGRQPSQEYRAKGPGSFSDYPMVCLINKGTASGAEILAAALRDDRNVTLIGERSFGKGSVQELSRLSDGSSMKITVAKWLTPKGQSITESGLKPDIEIKMTEQDYEEKKDPQLQKAIEVVKGLEND